MLNRKKYKVFLERNLEKIVFAVIDALIIARERQPDMLELVLLEAHAVLHSRSFNNHQPENETAWEILSRPIRIAAEFEFQRIHLVALVSQHLNNHSLEEFIIEEDVKAMQRMVA